MTIIKSPKKAEVFSVAKPKSDWHVEFDRPYAVRFTIKGTRRILFDAWQPDMQEDAAEDRKGSKKHKEISPEDMVYRCDDGTIGLPSVTLHKAIQATAKMRKDPRSPRKSALELYKVATQPADEMLSFGVEMWDFVDVRRIVNQATRGSRNKHRPGLEVGWTITTSFEIALPEYIRPADFHDVLTDAGRFNGIGAYRPVFGRFAVTAFDIEVHKD